MTPRAFRCEEKKARRLHGSRAAAARTAREMAATARNRMASAMKRVQSGITARFSTSPTNGTAPKRRA
jgi:hypothetical protein